MPLTSYSLDMKGEPALAATAAELLCDVWELSLGDGDVPIRLVSEATMLRMMGKPKHHPYVFFESGTDELRAAGLLVSKANRMAYLLAFAVAKGYRGQGYGGEALRGLETIAVDLGATTLTLVDATTTDFYEKRDYTLDTENFKRPTYYKQLVPVGAEY